MFIRPLFALSLAAAAFAAAPARAQDLDIDLDAIFAYTAIISTPVGAVAPVATRSMTDAPAEKLGVRAQYGRISGDGASANSVIGGVDLPLGRGSVGVSAGYRFLDCGDSELECSGHFIAGVNGEQRVVSRAVGTSLLALGVSGGFGYGKDDVSTALAANLGTPISFALTAGRVQIVPFVKPALAWGRISGEDEESGIDVAESGTRFMLGGGIGIMNVAPGLGINAGVQKVFIDGGRTVFGAGLSWNAL